MKSPAGIKLTAQRTPCPGNLSKSLHFLPLCSLLPTLPTEGGGGLHGTKLSPAWVKPWAHKKAKALKGSTELQTREEFLGTKSGDHKEL